MTVAVRLVEGILGKQDVYYDMIMHIILGGRPIGNIWISSLFAQYEQCVLLENVQRSCAPV